jgi:ribulose-phosphate 3-epimerase
MIEQVNPACDLGVDGGIDEVTAPIVAAAGANVLVAGTSAFSTDKSVAAAMELLRNAVTQVAQ